MSGSDNTSDKPARRKSDATLLGKSSQDLGDRVYTLEFGVNLSQISLEGLTHYSVSISRTNKDTNIEEKLSSSLEVSLSKNKHIVQVEGGPPVTFTVTQKTLDLSIIELDESIIEAVNDGLSWLQGNSAEQWVQENRRKIPIELLTEGIAVNLLMSSISTIIGGSVACHKKVMQGRQAMFQSKSDYVEAMFENLRNKLDEFTEVAINRGVQYYVANK